MITVFHVRPYGLFIERKSNLRRKKLQRTNQDSNFLGGSLNNRDNVRAPTQFRRERQPKILKYDFSSSADPSIFTSIATELLDWSYKTSWVFRALKSTSHFLKPVTSMSRRSDSSSEANSSCYNKSDAFITFKSSIISKDSNITDNIIRNVINV